MNILSKENIQNSSSEFYNLLNINGYKLLYNKGNLIAGDGESYITNFCKRIYNNNYESILVFGLGLGLIPYYFYNTDKCKNITVVEISSELIELINSKNYLTNIEIINADVFLYETQKKFDLIVSDIHLDSGEPFNSEKEILIERYKNNLKENGKLYFPIIDQLF